MTPKFLLTNAIRPAFALLEAVGVHSDIKAELEVLAIAGQETEWAARLQGGGGPARGFWQFETGPMSATAEVFRVCSPKLKFVCDECCVPFDRAHVSEALAWNDVLAAAMARLLLFTDPAPLPEVGDVQGGLALYLRKWAPGLPHPEVWPGRYGTALGLVQSKETT